MIHSEQIDLDSHPEVNTMEKRSRGRNRDERNAVFRTPLVPYNGLTGM
jgi:hypothetical protein